MPQVSVLATAVATIVSFLLGGLWYGPLFGKAWLVENRFDDAYLEQMKTAFNPAKTYGLTLLLSLLSAYVFGMFLGPRPALAFAAAAGASAGVCWVGASFANTYLWEAKSGRHLAINAGFHAVRFTLIGVCYGLLG